MKLRGGTAELRIETGRWCGLRRSRDEWICKMCEEGEVDVEHFLLHCTGLVEERMEMYVEIDERDCGGVARA